MAISLLRFMDNSADVLEPINPNVSNMLSAAYHINVRLLAWFEGAARGQRNSGH
jgi:hypothetical protein